MPLSCRTKIIQQQQLSMVKFLEKHTDMVGGPSENPIIAKRVTILWRVLAKKLNSFEDAVKKTSALWMKTWWNKKKLVKNALKRKDSGVLWAPLNLRILRLLKLCGEVTEEDCNYVNVITGSKAVIPEIKQQICEEDSLPSATTSLNNFHDERSMDCEHLNSTFDSHMNTPLHSPETKEIKSPEVLSSTNCHSESDLQSEFSCEASAEEDGTKTEEENSKALKNTAVALDRCALAIGAMAGAVNSQTNILSDALRAQGQMIAEALKDQGEIIAKALGKR